MRLSDTEQVNRECNLLSGLSCYDEMKALIWHARRVGLVPLFVEAHGSVKDPKWLVLDVIFEKGIPYYWLISFETRNNKEEIFSFTSAAAGNWPFCFRVSLVPLPHETRIAHPDDVREHIRGVKDLQYSNMPQAGSKRSKRWTSISKRECPNVYATLPLGKPYRAIDIGAMVPIFRTESRLLGLVIK